MDQDKQQVDIPKVGIRLMEDIQDTLMVDSLEGDIPEKDVHAEDMHRVREDILVEGMPRVVGTPQGMEDTPHVVHVQQAHELSLKTILYQIHHAYPFPLPFSLQ